MAMPVNLTFLVPQAMMKGLTKLGRWESSTGGSAWVDSLQGGHPTSGSLSLVGGLDGLEFLQGLLGGLQTSQYRHQEEWSRLGRTRRRSLCFLLLSWMRFVSSDASSCVVIVAYGGSDAGPS